MKNLKRRLQETNESSVRLNKLINLSLHVEMLRRSHKTLSNVGRTRKTVKDLYSTVRFENSSWISDRTISRMNETLLNLGQVYRNPNTLDVEVMSYIS